MDKVLKVIKREFGTRIKSKGFVIGTLFVPLVMLLVVFLLPMVMMKFSVSDTKTIVIIDETEIMSGEITNKLEDRKVQGNQAYEVINLKIAGERLLAADGSVFALLSGEDGVYDPKTTVNKKVSSEEVGGFIYLGKDALTGNKAEFYTRYVTDFSEREFIRFAVTAAFRKWRMDQKGWKQEDLRNVFRGIQFTVKKAAVALPGEGEEAEAAVEEKGQTYWITYVMVMMIYMSILIYGSLVLRSVIEEKSSRVVEIIVSSMKPFQMLTGKLLGVGSLGLLQFFIWGAIGMVITLYGGAMAGSMNIKGEAAEIISVVQIPPAVIIYFVIFFILGYFLYSSFYAAVGAAVNSEEEAQGMTIPITLFIIFGFMLMFAVINSPDGNLAVVLSMIPLFSPLIMFARITTVMPPWYEIWASILLLILSIFGSLWFVAKIYKVGILMYGKKPTLREMLKWLKYS